MQSGNLQLNCFLSSFISLGCPADINFLFDFDTNKKYWEHFMKKMCNIESEAISGKLKYNNNTYHSKLFYGLFIYLGNVSLHRCFIPHTTVHFPSEYVHNINHHLHFLLWNKNPIFGFTFKINKLQYLYFKLTTVKFFLVKRSTEQIANYQFKFTSTSYFPLNNLTINTTQKIFETTEWTCEKQQFAKYQKNIAMKKHCSIPSK